MNLRPEEISSIIKEQIKNYENKVELTDTGSVLKVGDGIASVYGLENAMAGELLEFPGEVYGMALNLEEDMVGAVMLGDDRGIKEGDVVKRTGNVVSVPVGDVLIGRVVNALGQPIDGKGPINTNKTRPVESEATGIMARKSVHQPLETGIKAIDAMIPIGKGQRELVIGDRQTGKTSICIDTILNQKGKDVILVDHNELAQTADGIEEANIVEIVDHHKVEISTEVPISIRVMPVGCTCTIVYQMYKENNVEVPYEIAGLLLSAILSDTLLFKSPTTTEMDKLACEELSKIANVDMESYAMEMFKAGTSLDEYSIEEIVNMDFKEFDMSGKRVGIGQVFTLDIDSIFAKKDEFLSHINSTDYDMLVLAITDIIKEGSYLIYKAEDKIIAEAFSVDASQGVFAEGVVSRKKQLVPNLTTAIKNI